MRIGRMVAGLAVLALALGACGSDDEPSATTAPPSPRLSSGLSFRPVVAVLAPPASAEPGDAIDPTPASEVPPGGTILANLDPAIEVPPGGTILANLDPATSAFVADYVLGPEQVDGSVIESATAGLSQFGSWEVNPVLRPGPEGIDAFNELAAACYEKDPTCPTGQLAIVVDGEVLSAPSINAPEFERDQIVIAGDFDEAEARALADRLS